MLPTSAGVEPATSWSPVGLLTDAIMKMARVYTDRVFNQRYMYHVSFNGLLRQYAIRQHVVKHAEISYFSALLHTLRRLIIVKCNYM